MFIPAFTTNVMTSDFLSSISPGWVVMFLDSNRLVFTFLIWLDLLCVVLAFRIFILKIFKLLPNYWHRVADITSFEKHVESSWYSDILPKFGEILFEEYVSEGNSHPVFYFDIYSTN